MLVAPTSRSQLGLVCCVDCACSRGASQQRNGRVISPDFSTCKVKISCHNSGSKQEIEMDDLQDPLAGLELNPQRFDLIPGHLLFGRLHDPRCLSFLLFITTKFCKNTEIL